MEICISRFKKNLENWLLSLHLVFVFVNAFFYGGKINNLVNILHNSDKHNGAQFAKTCVPESYQRMICWISRYVNKFIIDIIADSFSKLNSLR